MTEQPLNLSVGDIAVSYATAYRIVGVDVTAGTITVERVDSGKEYEVRPQDFWRDSSGERCLDPTNATLVSS